MLKRFLDGKGRGRLSVRHFSDAPAPVNESDHWKVRWNYSPVYTKALRNSTFSMVMATQGTSCFSCSGFTPFSM